ncbi:MAG TPA: hypothetical protein VFA63_07080 [Pseudonocardiaceae bacterium]|nr:hypothetical protein [Pseudonocardiaceae bacterium]
MIAHLFVSILSAIRHVLDVSIRALVTVRGILGPPDVSAPTLTSLTRYLDARRSPTPRVSFEASIARYEGSTAPEGAAVPPSRGEISNEEEHRNMTSRTPRRHRRLAFMAAGTAAAMVLLPGAASAQVVHSPQQFMSSPSGPGTPGDPPAGPSTPHVTPHGPTPNAPGLPPSPSGPGDLPVPGELPGLNGILPNGQPGLTGSHDHDGHHGDGPLGEVVHRDDTPNSHQIDDPKPPDHASGEVGKVDLLKSRLLDITRYDATIEDNGQSHADSTVLGLGGSRIVGSSADSRDHHRSGDNGDALKLCSSTGGLLCLSLLYHNTVATEDHDNSLAAARGGVAALCLLNKGRDHKDVTASYECNGLLSLGVAEGLGIAERDKEHGHTKADSANELLNLCIGKRDKLTTPCQGLGVEAVHSDSKSRSDKPDTERHSFLLGIDSNGKSTYLLDAPFGLALPDHCGDSAILCLLLNQGKSVIFKNPKGAGSAQEALRLDVLNRVLLVVLGQSETLAHETNEDNDHHNRGDHCDDHGNKGEEHGEHCEDHGNKGEEHGNGENNGGGGPELAQTGADVAGLLAGGFLLTGLGALTVAGTRRRAGKHGLNA